MNFKWRVENPTLKYLKQKDKKLYFFLGGEICGHAERQGAEKSAAASE